MPIVVESFGSEGVLVTADRADSGCDRSDMNVTANLAFPNDKSVLFDDDFVGFELFEHGFVTSFMSRFNLADHFHLRGDLREAFFSSNLSKFRIHDGLLIVFTRSGIFDVYFGSRDIPIVEKLEPKFCVFSFILRCFIE